MLTNTDIRLGMLIRYHGDPEEDPEDVDDVGIVVKMPDEDWHRNFHILWSASGQVLGSSTHVGHHTVGMIEDALYQRKMELIVNETR